jgi:diadenosine tetraphosphate (Ap4A) HIT family hydrolase
MFASEEVWMGCVYCDTVDGRVLWQGEKARITLARETGFPYWCRVVWLEHIKELSDLGKADRDHLMDLVAALELTLREVLEPTKMNLAALGTQAPHLHWHVIPRQADDPAYPAPVWQKPEGLALVEPNESLLDQIVAKLSQRLS